MKKRKILLGLVVVISVIVISIFAYVKLTSTKLVVYDGKRSVHKGVDENFVKNLFKTNEIHLDEHGEGWVYTYDELNILVDITTEHVEKLNKSLIVNVDDIDLKFKSSAETKEKLSELNNIRYESEYADIILEDNTFVLKEERVGDKLDIDRLIGALDNKLSESGKKGVSLYLSDYYIPFDTSKRSEEECKLEIDKYNNFKIEYTNGFRIIPENIIEYLVLEDGHIVFNEELREKAVKDIDKLIDVGLADYDTVGGNWEFTTNSGEHITVSGGTWGDYFNSAKESEYIVGKIAELQSETNREPIKSQDYPDEIPDKYVEISLEEQHLWAYENGELVMESPVVTGLKGKMDTPKGVYFISEMQTGRYLRGAGYVTWVNKWMRITNRGHGLHDATWRSNKEFGGNTYKYDGSHGCINLPKQFAYDIYDFLNTKDCVVIY